MAGHQKAERIHGPRTRTCRDILGDNRLVESVFLAISEENRMAEGAQAQLGPSPGLWRPRGRARLSADTPSHPVTLRGGRLCQPQVVQISHIFHKPVLVIICFKKTQTVHPRNSSAWTSGHHGVDPAPRPRGPSGTGLDRCLGPYRGVSASGGRGAPPEQNQIRGEE